MEILVTGGAGFIGSHLVERLLTDGHGVAVLDDFNDFYPPPSSAPTSPPCAARSRCTRSILRQAEAVSRVVRDGKFDAIIHLAARAGVRPSIQQPRLYVETNVTGTLNLLEAARQHGVGRFVFASSSSVYGLCKNPPFREDEPLPGTISPYAATKLAGEQLCSTYAHLYDAADGVPAVFHGVRTPPAARPGHPPVHPAHPPAASPSTSSATAAPGATIHVHRRHHPGRRRRAVLRRGALRYLQPGRKRDHPPCATSSA